MIALVAMTSIAHAEDGNPVSQVIQSDARLNDAIRNNDPAKAAPLYAEDFVLTTSSGHATSKTDMLRAIALPELKLEVNETQDVNVGVMECTAVLTGTLHQKGMYNGRSFDVFPRVTDTWVRTETRWRLLAGHASLLPR
jgi:ketosteroid isomerase-like protein